MLNVILNFPETNHSQGFQGHTSKSSCSLMPIMLIQQCLFCFVFSYYQHSGCVPFKTVTIGTLW